MDCLEELANVLNKAGVELTNLNSKEKDLIKKLFLWSELMMCSSKSNESHIRPYANYLSVLYAEKSKDNS